MSQINYRPQTNEQKHSDMIKLARYRNKLRRTPRLRYLNFELTDCCNMECLHCGSSCTPHNSTFLSAEDIEAVIARTAKKITPQSVMITLTGGEPMLHPKLYSIAEMIKGYGFLWGMTTNGTLIDIKAARQLKAVGMGSVSISIDGTKAEHERLRGMKNSFDRAVEGICALQDVFADTIPIQITTVISKMNFHKLDEIYELMKTLDIKSWRITNIEPIGRAMDSELLLDNRQMHSLLSFIREKRVTADMEITYGCSHFATLEFEKEIRDYYFICGCGINTASVLCNGDIFGCLDIERRAELIQGNIHKDDFLKVWKNGFRVFRADRTKKCGMCKGCSDRVICGGDSMHTWDYENNEPRMCLRNMFKS